MKLTIDFETRSEVDLRKTGSRVYAEDPTTRPLMIAVKVDNKRTRIWLADEALPAIEHDMLPLISEDRLLELVSEAQQIEAFNVAFERDMWNRCCTRLYGWPALPEYKLRCAAATARRHGLPGSLKAVGAALQLDVQKSNSGHALMLQMCKPRQKTKLHPETRFYNDPERMWNLADYCITDVETEHQASTLIGELRGRELLIWQMDQRINERGVYIDRPAAEALYDMGEQYKAELVSEYKAITHPQLSPSRVTESLEYFAVAFGDTLPNMQAATIREALQQDDLHMTLRRCLEIRQSTSRTSNKKYPAMLARSTGDGRLHGSHLFYGAHTGRWSSLGLQTQNMPRPTFPDSRDFIEVLMACGSEIALDLWQLDPLDIGASCVRGCVSAAPGHMLLCADYSAIEGRVLAWLAGEDDALQVYIDGRDPYIVAASTIYGIPYDDIDRGRRDDDKHIAHRADKMRAVGKVSELALGYQGSDNAYRVMADGYGVDLSDVDVKAVIKAWRQNRPQTVQLWREMNKAALLAVRHPGTTYTYRTLSFRMVGRTLRMRLPSGRIIVYYDPLIGENRFGQDALTYMGTDQKTRKWCRLDTYGGKLTENAVQAVARDLLCDGMLTAEPYYPIVMHVHDEAMSEIPTPANPDAELKNFCECLVTVGDWAEGLPLEAEGWYGKRYRK